MSDRLPHEKGFHVSWDQIHRDSRALAHGSRQEQQAEQSKQSSTKDVIVATVSPDAAAAALELIHCASLVHDDMPCFDDADTRRGKPSVHKAYSEPLALLTGDSLIVLAFELLGRAAKHNAERTAQLTVLLAQRTGMPGGICAGQGWESEAEIDLGAWDLPPVFKWLATQGGLAEAELLKTFNAGLGMVAVVSPDKLEAAKEAFASDGHTAIEIGTLTPGSGVSYKGSLL